MICLNNSSKNVLYPVCSRYTSPLTQFITKCSLFATCFRFTDAGDSLSAIRNKLMYLPTDVVSQSNVTYVELLSNVT